MCHDMSMIDHISGSYSPQIRIEGCCRREDHTVGRLSIASNTKPVNQIIVHWQSCPLSGLPIAHDAAVIRD